jgi:hypothetical protein
MQSDQKRNITYIQLNRLHHSSIQPITIATPKASFWGQFWDFVFFLILLQKILYIKSYKYIYKHMQAGKDVKEIIKYNTFLQLHKFRRIGNNVIWVSLTSLIFHRHCMFQHIVRLTNVVYMSCEQKFVHACSNILIVYRALWLDENARSELASWLLRGKVLCYSFCLARLAWLMYERCWWQTKLIPNIPGQRDWKSQIWKNLHILLSIQYKHINCTTILNY